MTTDTQQLKKQIEKNKRLTAKLIIANKELVFQNKEKENVFTVIETWESDVLLSEHVQTAHFKAFQADTDGQLEGFDIQIMTKIL